MTDEQKNAIDHAQKILRAVKLYDLAGLLAAAPAAIDREAVGKERFAAEDWVAIRALLFCFNGKAKR